MRTLNCKRCFYKWEHHRKKNPHRCPNCKSQKWKEEDLKPSFMTISCDVCGNSIFVNPKYKKSNGFQTCSKECQNALFDAISKENWASLTIEQQKEFLKHIAISGFFIPDTCTIIRGHHEILKDDPERLSSDFIQKIVGKKCDNENLKS